MYYTERAKKLYEGLVRDVYHHNGDPARNYSDGYDLAMEAIAFLCEHIGKRLSDRTTIMKYGNPRKTTILKGCFFVVTQHITKQVTYERKSVNIDDPKVMEMDECIFIPMAEDTNDWDKVDEIILKLQLTPEEIQLLDYRMSGDRQACRLRSNDCRIAAFENGKEIYVRFIKIFEKTLIFLPLKKKLARSLVQNI